MSKSEDLLKRLSSNIPAEVVAKNATVQVGQQNQLKVVDTDRVQAYGSAQTNSLLFPRR